MRKITKREANKFNELFKSFVIENKGIFKTINNVSEAIIDTNYGKLSISLHENTKSEIYSIFTRFKQINLVPFDVGCNRHSGKFNFHFSKSKHDSKGGVYSPNEVFNSFMGMLNYNGVL